MHLQLHTQCIATLQLQVLSLWFLQQKATLCLSGTASVQSTRAKTLQLHAKLALQKCVLYMLT